MFFRIQERDIQILKALNVYRYMRTGQVKRFAFPECSSIQSCRRRLKYLFHNEYVGRIQPYIQIGKGQPDTAYFLKEKGADLVRTSFPDEEIHLFRKSHRVKHAFLDHALDLSEFRLNLELALSENEIVELHRFVADFELKKHVDRMNGKKRYRLFNQVEHPLTKELFTVYPDAMIILKGKGALTEHQKLYFLEIDRGTMSLERIKQKVTGYFLYRQMGKVAKTSHLSFKKFGKFDSFRVLMVTNSEKRMLNIRKKLEGIQGENLVWAGCLDMVTSESILYGDVFLDHERTQVSLLRK